jgi:hypothetical protein
MCRSATKLSWIRSTMHNPFMIRFRTRDPLSSPIFRATCVMWISVRIAVQNSAITTNARSFIIHCYICYNQASIQVVNIYR